MSKSRALVLRGDAAHLPLPDASVDLIVTSPPYFGLRSYTDGGEHYDGQIGSEGTPREFLGALWACTREWMRVLKPEGSLFVNLGDKYAGSQPHADHGTGASTLNGHGGAGTAKDRNVKFRRAADFGSAPTKSLLGMPWRYAIGCVDDLGLILRAEIVWSKPNGLPESVTDRVRRSHEQVFHFTRQPRYFAAVDEVREPHSPHTVKYYPPGGSGQARGGNQARKRDAGAWHSDPGGTGLTSFNPVVARGAPFPVDRYAHRKRPDEKPVGPIDRGDASQWLTGAVHGVSGQEWNRHKAQNPDRITGYACACPDASAPTCPAVVLDPFGGTGTTALVASVLGRTGVTVDRSADYCRLARWRVSDPAERARAMQVPKPPPVPDGQGDLFSELEAS